ncbi:hypothetical protein J6590_023811 [Homalodisca vitripennis]|nr:hypothetical protein J6590_092280 [Homalodisca vitripennis]KAG8273299.1 hypothetical protein J6590_023811 [Homalodisca vitripennis]
MTDTTSRNARSYRRARVEDPCSILTWSKVVANSLVPSPMKLLGGVSRRTSSSSPARLRDCATAATANTSTASVCILPANMALKDEKCSTNIHLKISPSPARLRDCATAAIANTSTASVCILPANMALKDKKCSTNIHLKISPSPARLRDCATAAIANTSTASVCILPANMALKDEKCSTNIHLKISPSPARLRDCATAAIANTSTASVCILPANMALKDKKCSTNIHLKIGPVCTSELPLFDSVFAKPAHISVGPLASTTPGGLFLLRWPALRSLNALMSSRICSNKPVFWWRCFHRNSHKYESSKLRLVPHSFLLRRFADAQSDSILCVCAPVVGSTKFSEWVRSRDACPLRSASRCLLLEKINSSLRSPSPDQAARVYH